jgi:hypothetical protein
MAGAMSTLLARPVAAGRWFATGFKSREGWFEKGLRIENPGFGAGVFWFFDDVGMKT